MCLRRLGAVVIDRCVGCGCGPAPCIAIATQVVVEIPSLAVWTLSSPSSQEYPDVRPEVEEPRLQHIGTMDSEAWGPLHSAIVVAIVALGVLSRRVAFALTTVLLRSARFLILSVGIAPGRRRS